MRVTFILKDLSESFFEGGFYSIGLNNLNDFEKFFFLKDRAARKELKITSKIGNGSFRDKVEFNQILRDNKYQKLEYKIEPRRGYKLVTFNFL
jgi:hypothetical protein